jgi:fructose-specific phosphotransferase system IIA component
MKLSDYLSEDVVIADIQSTTKEGVINEMLDLFKNDKRVVDLAKVKESVLEREKIMSTGVGKNFAIPHGKTDAVTDIICAFGRSAKPIEYQSLDDQPVYLVFLLVGKDNLVSIHIKLLSRISRMMTKDEFRDKLMKAQTKQEILEIFREEEKSYFEL